jgi:hypothetical protein
MFDVGFVSRRLPPHSTATLAALPAMSLIPFAPFRFLVSENRKGFVISAISVVNGLKEVCDSRKLSESPGRGYRSPETAAGKTPTRRSTVMPQAFTFSKS